MIYLVIGNLVTILGFRMMMAGRPISPEPWPVVPQQRIVSEEQTVEDWLKDAYVKGEITVERLEELLARFEFYLDHPSTCLKYVSL